MSEVKVNNYDEVEWLSITDDQILAISNNHFITKPDDFNLRKGPRNSESYLFPIPGGLYDGRIFGSIHENRCNCGAITVPNVPCMECGTMLLDNIQRKIRYAAIDATVFYTTKIKVPHLINLLRKNFKIRIDVTEEILADKVGIDKDYKMITLLYFCQVNYDEESKSLIFTDKLDDIEKLSLEGIVKIVKEHKPELIDELMKYMNRYVPVTPAILRKVKFFVVNGKKEIKMPKSTAYYRSIIMAVDTCKSVAAKSKDLYSIACHYANLRLYIASVMTRMSKFLKSSKQTIVRSEYSVNSSHSGRAVISGDPELPVDTIKIPRMLAYEMYKKAFLKWLVKDRKYDQADAVRMYNNPTEEVNKIFDEFCSGKVVLVNRPPSIHRQNIQAYKLALSEDYGIHFPLLTTQAQNAD